MVYHTFGKIVISHYSTWPFTSSTFSGLLRWSWSLAEMPQEILQSWPQFANSEPRSRNLFGTSSQKHQVSGLFTQAVKMLWYGVAMWFKVGATWLTTRVIIHGIAILETDTFQSLLYCSAARKLTQVKCLAWVLMKMISRRTAMRFK